MNTSPIQLDLELCKACGVCIELCPEKVFDRDKLGEPSVARPEDARGVSSASCTARTSRSRSVVGSGRTAAPP